MPQQQPRLRKREIAFALAIGAIGASAAALVLDEDVGPDRHHDRGDREAEMLYQVADFDTVSVIGPQDVIVVAADQFKVSASGSPEALALFEAVVEDGGLVIRPRQGMSFGDMDEVTFTVAMPALTGIAVDGSGEVRVERVAGPRFEGTVGGSGTLSIGQIEAEEASLSVTGSGDLDAGGRAGSVAIDITGSGEVHASGLVGTNASVAIEGSGDVDLTVLEQADIAITGSGEVDISGPAQCTVERTGSGEVRCEGGGGDVPRGNDD